MNTQPRAKRHIIIESTIYSLNSTYDTLAGDLRGDGDRDLFGDADRLLSPDRERLAAEPDLLLPDLDL